MNGRHVAIVGGGYSGTLLAIHLLRQSVRVTLVERGPQMARGVAYGTARPEHLLNVRASGMSAFPDQPRHFADWLQQAGAGIADDFAPRQLYGRYLQDLLQSALAEHSSAFAARHADVTAISDQALILSTNERIEADAIVLAVGNLPPEVPRAIPSTLAPDIYVPDPWAEDITEGLRPSDRVLLIGTGLTAVDVAITLDTAGFAGEILALSRRGLLPHAHAAITTARPAQADGLTSRCTSLLGHVRAHARSTDWRTAVDALRPFTQKLWSDASREEKSRFLRHLRPWWDIHRHRIAPAIANRLRSMQGAGRLEVAAGKIMAVEPDGDRSASVTWRPRGSGETRTTPVRRIVNCTGPQANIVRAGEPLLVSLLAKGRIRPDACGIGIDVDAQCRVIGANGTSDPKLFAVGPMTRGALWEIVAVPDIRAQVATLAERLAHP